MESKKKFIILLMAAGGGIMVFLFLGIFLQNDKAESYEKLIAYEEKDLITIAACPTFHYMLEKIEKIGNSQEIKTVKTETTTESLNLLEQEKVNLIISGRALRPEEPGLLFKEIGPGYDFLFNREVFILEKEMQFIPFYTDLSLERVIEDFDFISEQNLARTEDIFEALDKGIVITFLEGRMKGEPVHVFQEDEKRLRLSRLPRLYYLSDFKEKKINFIKEIIKEN